MTPAACPPSARRRRLERKSDRLYAVAVNRLRGLVVPLDPADVVVIARSGDVIPFHRTKARTMLSALGVPELLDEIDAARSSRHPCDVPLVIFVDGHACVAWVRGATMTAGGAA